MDYIADTNILVYETILDSKFHNDVVSRLNELGQIYVPTIVLIELSIVLRRLHLDNKLIVERIREIMDEDRYIILEIETKDIKNALDMILEKDINMSELNDKIILSMAKRLKLGIYTYDKKLRAECKEHNIVTL
jgi:predicted nucleic acid-binding protein